MDDPLTFDNDTGAVIESTTPELVPITPSPAVRVREVAMVYETDPLSMALGIARQLDAQISNGRQQLAELDRVSRRVMPNNLLGLAALVLAGAGAVYYTMEQNDDGDY